MSNKLPWDKFTYSDWIGDINLQMCSYAAQGLWMSMLCVLWDSKSRGRLVCNDGSPMPIEKLSFILRHSTDEVQTLVTELIDGGVCSVGDDGVIYCRRMVREQSDREAETARNRQWRASKSTATTLQQHCNNNATTLQQQCNNTATTLQQQCNNTATTLQQQCNAIEREGELEGELDKEKDPKRGLGLDTEGAVDNSLPVDNPVDSPPSQSHENFNFSPQVSRLAEQIETATVSGDCAGIGGDIRRNAILYQAEAFPSPNPAVWFDAMSEAIAHAQTVPRSRQYELLQAMRKYPDGVLSVGTASRCDELIRLTAQKIRGGKCAAAIGHLPNRRKRDPTTVPESLKNANCGAF